MKVWVPGFLLFLGLFIQVPDSIGQTTTEAFNKINARILFLLEEDKDLDSIDLYLDQAHLVFLGDDQAFEAYAQAFIDLGRLLIRANMPDKATLRLHQLWMDLESDHQDQLPLISQARYEYARALYYKGQDEDCIQQLKANLSFISENDLTDYEDTQLNLLGNAYRRIDQPLDAIEQYELALSLRIARFGPKSDPVAGSYNNLGNAYSDIGIYNKALEFYEASLGIRTPLLGKDHPRVVGVLMNTALLFQEKGELQKARKIMSEIKEIYLKNEMAGTPDLAMLYNNIGSILRQIGALDEALDYYLEAEVIFKEVEPTRQREQAIILNNIANVYSAQGDSQKAIDFQQEAIAKALEVFGEESAEVAQYYSNLGLEYNLLNDFEKSISMHNKAISILEKKPVLTADLANIRNNLAESFLASNQLEQALNTNQQALADQINLFGKKHPATAYTYLQLAKTYLALGDKTTALQFVQEALISNHPDFESSDLHQNPPVEGALIDAYLFESLLLKARLLPEQAPLLFQQANTLLDHQRAQLISRQDQITLASQAKALSCQAINFWMERFQKDPQPKYLQEVHYYIEKSKSNVLLNTIVQNQALQFSGVPDTLIQLEQKLQSDIQYFRQELSLQPDSLRKKLYQKELFEARQAYSNLVASLSESYPRYYDLKHKNHITALDSLQQNLPSNLALINYFVTDSSGFAMKVTRKGVEVKRLEITKGYIQDLVGLRKSIYYQLNDEYLAYAFKYYKKLLPFQFSNNIDRLVISSDGSLSNLPFGALLTSDQNQQNPDFKKLPYLIRDYSVSYTPSLSLFQLEKKQLPSSQDDFVAMAPIFKAEILIPINEEDGMELVASAGRNNPTANTLPLPGTEVEVLSISELFKQAEITGEIYMNESATEAQLKDESISKVAYLHIATHGFVNEDQPNLSGIQLYPVQGKEDNILFSGEVYNLNLNARLLVLSACETGLGKEAKGEGLLGFSRAFRYAGAQNLIVSQWQVHDQATTQLMESFYKNHLFAPKNKRDFSFSLKEAKLQLIQSETYYHPYYWAGIILVGE